MRLVLRESLVKEAKTSRRGPSVSHLLFIDDSILIGKASEKGAQILKKILKDYEVSSGQCINFNKSTVFYSNNTSKDLKWEVANIPRVQNSNTMERYLDLQNVVGKNKKSSS